MVCRHAVFTNASLFTNRGGRIIILVCQRGHAVNKQGRALVRGREPLGRRPRRRHDRVVEVSVAETRGLKLRVAHEPSAIQALAALCDAARVIMDAYM